LPPGTIGKYTDFQVAETPNFQDAGGRRGRVENGRVFGRVEAGVGGDVGVPLLCSTGTSCDVSARK